MEEHTNSAKRILNLLTKVAHTGDGNSTAQVWAGALGLDVSKVDDDPYQVQSKLKSLREEIDSVSVGMSSTSFSTDLYAPYLEKIRRAVTVHNLNAKWVDYKQYLKADTLLALRYCSEIIPSEAAISMEELQTVLDKVVLLKSEIESLELSVSVRNFLLRQLEIIEEGIHSYPIKGGGAITKAFRDGFTECASSSPAVDTENDKEGAKKVGSVWEAFKKAGDVFVVTDKIATAYYKLASGGYETSKNLLNYLNNS